VNVKGAKSNDYDLAEGNTVDGVRAHISQGCEKGIRMRTPSMRRTTACVLGFHGAVEVGGWTRGSVPVVVPILDGIGDFLSLSALTPKRKKHPTMLAWS